MDRGMEEILKQLSMARRSMLVVRAVVDRVLLDTSYSPDYAYHCDELSQIMRKVAVKISAVEAGLTGLTSREAILSGLRGITLAQVEDMFDLYDINQDLLPNPARGRAVPQEKDVAGPSMALTKRRTR